jgi:hypothetical protein
LSTPLKLEEVPLVQEVWFQNFKLVMLSLYHKYFNTVLIEHYALLFKRISKLIFMLHILPFTIYKPHISAENGSGFVAP